jgi:hypothetical protein
VKHSALDTFAIVCTWVFGIVGLTSSAVTLSGLRRRPRVDAKWLTEDTDDGHAPWEGLVVEVRPRRRAVRVEGLELELQYGERRGLKRRRSRHFFELSSNPRTPTVLHDGEILSAVRHTDDAVDDAQAAIGDARLDSESWVLVHWRGGRRVRIHA